MQRIMLSGKIHRATLTSKSLDYVGSITIDEELLERAGIEEHEKVLVANVNTGERAETYAIKAPRGSGEVCLNGATARLGEPGDLLIVMSFALADEDELAEGWEPQIVHVDDKNRPL